MAKQVSQAADEAGTETKAPTIIDLIDQAVAAEREAQILEQEAQEAAQRVRDARTAARTAFDNIFAALVTIKANHRESQAFRESKLGRLLDGIR